MREAVKNSLAAIVGRWPVTTEFVMPTIPAAPSVTDQRAADYAKAGVDLSSRVSSVEDDYGRTGG